MKRVFKSFLGLVLAVSMVFGCFTTTAFADSTITPKGYVTIDVEKFTLGQGYYIEPIKLPFYEDDNGADILTRLLGEGNYKNTGKVKNGFYLSKIKDSCSDSVNIPTYISSKKGAPSNESNKGKKDSNWLGEFDYGRMSGWMYFVNNVCLNVGCSGYHPQDGDVIRWQFTVYGYGGDLGTGFMGSWKATVANKDVLTAQLAKINSSSSKNEIINNDSKIYNDAVKTAENMEASQADTDIAAQALSKLLSDSQKQVVTDFSELDAAVKIRSVAKGTSLDSLKLPSSLEATVGGQTQTISGITWSQNPNYDATTAGTYTFSAILPSTYTSQVNMPTITVTVAVSVAASYVTIDAEKFTLGQGYIKEPVLAPIYEGDSVASVLKRVLGDGNYKEKTTKYGTYFEALRDSVPESLNIPEYITKATGISNTKNTGLLNSGWLGEFDYSAATYSGWMYCVNNANTNAGAGSWTPKNGDVIRFQFSLCMGSDLGAALSYEAPYADVANKDVLTAQLAKVNSSSYKNGILSSYADAYSSALKTAKNMEATQAETDSAASALSKAYDQYIANISSSSGGSHHSSSSGSSVSAANTTATNSASTVMTSSTATGGSISTVSTQPDAVPVINGGRSNVSVTVSSEIATVVSAATAEKPAEIKITAPTASIIEQINSSSVKTVDLSIKVPAAVANNTNANVKISINAEASVLQAAKDAQKDITLSVTNSDTGKEVYSWTFSGSDLKNSVASVTNVNLVLNVSPVKNVAVASSVVAGNTADKKASGIVLQFGNSGLLPSTAKVKVYVGDQEGCTPNSKVFLYYLNSTTKALEQMPQSDYTVDANGYVTISIAHCSDYVLLPKAATNAYPVKSDTSSTVGVKDGKTYTYAITVSGKAVPTFTVGNSKAFTTTVKCVGNKYYFTVKAVGAAGTITAVYSTLPRQKPVVMSYVAVAK